MNSRIVIVVSLFAAAVIALLLTLALHFHGNAVKSEEKAKQLQSDNNLQALTISAQTFTFQRSNEISGAAQQYAVQIIGDSQEKEIEYRTILKTEPTCSLLIPDDIAHSLLEYTYRLRTSAMHTDTGQSATESSAATSTGCRLTYGQALYWIDPLLTTIDQLNNQLDGIKQAEEARNVQTPMDSH